MHVTRCRHAAGEAMGGPVGVSTRQATHLVALQEDLGVVTVVLSAGDRQAEATPQAVLFSRWQLR